MTLNYKGSTLEEAQQALGFIPSDDRDVWIQMGMAIRHEFSDAGFDVWDDWSRAASNYDEAAVKSSWKSFKRSGSGGAITIGTLFAEAKRHGWTPEKRTLSQEEKSARDAEAKQRRAQRLEEDRLEQERLTRLSNKVAEAAGAVWDLLKPTGRSPYLGRKQVRGYGVGFARVGIVVVVDENSESVEVVRGQKQITAFFERPEEERHSFKYLKPGVLVVPLRNADGDIRNLQLIFQTGKKTFLKFGQKQGCFHLIGADGIDALSADLPLWFAEGYATAATIHEAIGHPVAVCFDAGNLLPVAKQLRDLLPERQFAFAADNDVETDKNPGVTKARAAANQVGGVVAVPDFSMLEADDG